MRYSRIRTLVLRGCVAAFIHQAVFLIIFGSSAYCARPIISGYRSIYLPFYGPGRELRLATREFEMNSVKMLLVVDPVTFDTYVTPAAGVNTHGPVDDAVLSKTPFVSSLERYSNAPAKTRNYGMTASQGAPQAVFLTIDLCPSSRELDKKMFEATENTSSSGGPVPVNVAVSGAWIKRHGDELRWLLGEERSGRLDITWINHSYTHPYKGKALPDEDFLASAGVDLDKEVLANEALMLENGVTPTPFFRFPGLISNEAAIRRLRALSLIPIGANAWLAKSEAPVDGSFILVHGNGNEPKGIKLLLDFYRQKDGEFKDGRARLLSIKKAFISPEARSTARR